MPTHNEDVYTFNKAFGVFISDTLNLNLINEDKHLANLRYSLIEEEVSELKEAIENNDFTEIIDGLSDILYVAYGAGVSFGLNLDNDFTDYLNYMDIPISLETTTFFKNCREIYAEILTNSPKIDDFNKLFQDNITNYTEKIKRNLIDYEDVTEFSSNLCQLILNVYLLGHVYDIDLDAAFTIVHNSNMSKLCATEELAKKTIQYYMDNEPRYDSPSYRKSDLGNYYVIFNKNTGKILKSIKYNPASFTNILSK